MRSICVFAGPIVQAIAQDSSLVAEAAASIGAHPDDMRADAAELTVVLDKLKYARTRSS